MSSKGQKTPPPPYSPKAAMPAVQTISQAVSRSEKPPPEPEPGPQPRIKYPISVFFIISNEFCERFSYYGMRTILALYLAYLGYSEDKSTMIYHVFVMLCYFTPLIGGIIADSYWGKYKTILYVSLLYAFGNIVLSVGSVKSLNISHVALSMIGLFLIGTGTGGIKPCVSSFGGDQFVLPQQERQLQRFFSVFYFSINAGSVISCFITPMLRESVACFGEDVCYPLAFGVPALLMCLSVVIFVCGKPMYKCQPPTKENVAVEVVKCWVHALKTKWKSQGNEKKHWIDYADDKYSLKFIEETKVVLKLIYLFSPTIVFWALYEQQGSRWTFQASHMDGDIGFYVIQPDQMQTVNSVMCLAFIPIFESAIYPLLDKMRIVRTPLQKLSYGGILAAVAFLISGFIQLKIEASEPVLPTNGISHLRLYNTLNCPLTINSDDLGITGNINEFDTVAFTQLSVSKLEKFNLDIEFGQGCNEKKKSFSVELDSKMISSYMFTKREQISLEKLGISNSSAIEKSKDGNPKIQAIFGGSEKIEVQLSSEGGKLIDLNFTRYQTDLKEVNSYQKYTVIINGKKSASTVYLKSGGVYSLLINNTSQASGELRVITEPNNLNMLWQLPQYFVITFAEIMFSITGVEFSFTQSPVSMKSVVSSLWLLTDAFGNVIILVIAGVKMFDSQASEFFLFAGLMAIVMGLFILLARSYEYVDAKTFSEETEIRRRDPNNL